jgi:hypothetical protein
MYNQAVAFACDSLSGMLKKVEGMRVVAADGIDGDHRAGDRTPGCQVHATAEFESGAFLFPHDTMKEDLEADSWREDISRAGDGPASTTYSLFNGDVRCVFSAIWSSGGSNAPTRAPTIYELEVSCFGTSR